jgi:outer membrane protein OmpA-like peptidoglycan-associated protein
VRDVRRSHVVPIQENGCARSEPPAAAAVDALPATSAQVAGAATTVALASEAASTTLAAAEAAAIAGGFDPSSVPVSSASLPPFPFFKTPDGLVSVYDDKDKHISYDGQYFIAGDKPVLVEGRIFRDKFNLQNDDRAYSELEFHKNYENIVTALGGRKINSAQYTREVVDAVGGRDAVEKHHYGAVAVPDYRHDSYLIRTADKEYWIDISSGAIPLHGYIVALEKQGMQQSVGLIDAAAMKQAIDDTGRVALYINFDVDKATLRADAQPLIDEIRKLLEADPALKLSIEGHTDNTGSAAHNQQLSAARARSVLGALVGLGIDPARLQSRGHGQDQPIADNASEDGRAKNRRVELIKL